MVEMPNNLTKATEVSGTGIRGESQYPEDLGQREAEVLVDGTNIESHFRMNRITGVDFGALIDLAVREFGRRIARVFNDAAMLSCGNGPRWHCRKVSWFASIPVNYHPDDKGLVQGTNKRLARIADRHGFEVQEIPWNHHGYHVRKADRAVSKSVEERTWEQKEKGLDVSLAARLMRRCLAPDRPDAVLVLTGDADQAYVLQDIIRNNPEIAVGVAAFRSDLASIFWPDNVLGFQWRTCPILLDKFLPKVPRARQTNGSTAVLVDVA
jgi:hypothetical protein